MKNLRNILTSLLCSLMLVVTVGNPLAYSLDKSGINNEAVSVIEQTLGESNLVANAKAKTPKLNKTSTNVNVGKSVSLKVNNNSKRVTWSTSNKKIATVSSNGKVTGKKAGTAKITAKLSNGKKLTCTVKVKAVVSNTTVYITNTGHKYHKSSCRYLRKSKIKTTLTKAKSGGYTACSVCY